MTKTLLRGTIAALGVVANIIAVQYRDQLSTEALEHWVAGAGMAGPFIFILIYALGTVIFLPGSVLTLAGGAIFGPVWGTIYNLTGATLGATIAFIIARYLAADWVERKSHSKLKQLKNGVETEGWRFIAFVRLVPLFPFNVLNYALGLTRIRLSHYIVASYLFMLPGALAYTYLGYAGREAVAGGQAAIQKGLLALALLATVAFLPRLITRLRLGPMLDVESLQQRIAGTEPPLILDVRSSDEFEGELGHIAGAVNIPLADLPTRISELNANLEKPVAIVCRTDVRSSKATLLLSRNGFSDIHVVRGGMIAWNEHGYPVER